MNSTTESPEDDSLSAPSRLVAFRPLFWWMAVSVLLLAYDFHRINAPRTTISASVTIDGRSLESGERFFVSIDGESVSLANPVAIGKRRINIGMKDATVYEEDVDVWYGENNIGSVSLNRQRGILDLEINPRADLVQFKGPYREFSITNASVIRTNIPVGTYEVSLSYGRLKKRGTVLVRPNSTVTEVFAPDVGVAEIGSNRAEAQFVLSSTNRSFRTERGILPQTLSLIPGTYSLEAWIGDYRKVEQLEIVRGETNLLSVVFDYGALDIATVPGGVSVRSKGREIGVTPARLELQPGSYDLQLRLAGFQTLALPVQVEANQTVSVSTNLVNLNFTEALRMAQQSAQRGDYQRAVENIGAALSIDPSSSMALGLQSEYRKNLNSIEKQNATLARRELIKAEFERLTQGIEHADIFDSHNFVAPNPFQLVRDAVRAAIPKCRARYVIESEAKIDEHIVLFKARSKGMTGYGRHCVVLVAENGATETQMVAKLWDYTPGTKSGVSIGALLNLNRGIPVHPRHFPANERQFILNRRQAVIDEFRELVNSEIKRMGGGK